MGVDVQCELTLPRPREEVAAYAADPDNTTSWYANINAVEWETPRPLAVGSRLTFIATFLGRRLSYTYEIRELVPGERLVMRHCPTSVPDRDHLPMRRAMTKDLERLSEILVQRADRGLR